MNSDAGPSHVTLFPNWHLSQGYLGYLAITRATNCVVANMVCSWAEYVFILKNYFTSELFATVHEAFSNIYPDKYKIRQYTVWKQISGHKKCLWQETCLILDSLQLWLSAIWKKIKGIAGFSLNDWVIAHTDTTTLLRECFGNRIVRYDLWAP